MSRLIRHKVKKNLYLLLTVILLIVIAFTFGFQIIIKGSVFIANLFNKSQSVETQTTNVLSDIQINSIPESTNSAKIKIEGLTTNIDELIIFLNSQEEKRIELSESKFDTFLDNLKDGENKIYFIGEYKKNKKRVKTDIYLVSLISEKPKIEISEPQDNLITQRNEIRIVGKTSPNVDLKINNLPGVVGASGEFSQYIKLNEGKNEILISVTDMAGNKEEKKLTVTYEK